MKSTRLARSRASSSCGWRSDLTGRSAERHSDPDLLSPLTHHERDETGEPDHSQHQGNRGECREEIGTEPWLAQRFRNHSVESANRGNRLLGIDGEDHLAKRTGKEERVRRGRDHHGHVSPGPLSKREIDLRS